MMFYSKQVVDGQVVSVESKDNKALSPNFVRAEKADYDSFIASLPEPEPQPERPDANKRLDDLEIKLRLGGFID